MITAWSGGIGDSATPDLIFFFLLSFPLAPQPLLTIMHNAGSRAPQIVISGNLILSGLFEICDVKETDLFFFFFFLYSPPSGRDDIT